MPDLNANTSAFNQYSESMQLYNLYIRALICMYPVLIRTVGTLHKTSSASYFHFLTYAHFIHTLYVISKEEHRGKGAKSYPTFYFPAVLSLQHQWLAIQGCGDLHFSECHVFILHSKQILVQMESGLSKLSAYSTVGVICSTCACLESSQAPMHIDFPESCTHGTSQMLYVNTMARNSGKYACCVFILCSCSNIPSDFTYISEIQR